MRGTIQTRSKTSPDQLVAFPDIERVARKNKRRTKEHSAQATEEVQEGTSLTPNLHLPPIIEETNMADTNNNENNGNRRRTMGDYVTHASPRDLASIVRPAPNANHHFNEVKPALLQLLTQNAFAGLDHEDPFAHLTTFYELCGSMGLYNEEEEALFRRAFPFSLIGKAKTWLQAQPGQSLTTWDAIESKFITRFFPASKHMDAKTAISVFTQGIDEPLCEAWERFKLLLRKCPGHGFDDLTQIHIFRNGLRPQTKMLLDASFGGDIMSKTAEEALNVIEAMASSDQQVQQGRLQVQKRGMLELGSQDALLAQNKIITQQIEALTQQMAKLPQQLQSLQVPSQQVQHVLRCDLCGGEHSNGFCQEPTSSHEEVQYMGNQGRQGNQFIPQPQGWRNNGNFNNAGSSNRPPQNPPLYERTSKLEDTLTQFIQVSMTNQKNTEASIKNLEVQVGQLAKQLAESQGGSFSANTITNPIEHCKVVTTRSGREFGVVSSEKERKDGRVEKERVVVEECDEEKVLEGEKKESEKEKK